MNGAVTQADRDAAAEYLAGLGEDLAVLVGIRNGGRDDHPLVQAFAGRREAETERCARIAESHSDDRGGRDRNFDWHDGYQDGCKGAAQSIRSTPGDVL